MIHNSVKVGKFTVIEENVEIRHGVEIGNFVLIKSGTVIGEDTFIDSYVRSSGHNHIGRRVTIRFGATIARSVIIGDEAFISPNVMTIYTKHDHTKVPKPTIIGKNSFIGTAAVIGPGVKIGDGVTIGAMSYVTKDCLEQGIYFGIPAKKIR